MRTAYLSLFFLAALAPACSSSSSGAPATEDTGDAGATATFTQIYTDIISKQCVECHQPGQIGVTEGMLDMSTQSAAYTNLVGVAAAGAACGGKGTRVTAGDADKSIFYLKVSDDDPTPCGEKMPLGGPALSGAQSDEIEGWINAGANND
jgi:hypothetical protein